MVKKNIIFKHFEIYLIKHTYLQWSLILVNSQRSPCPALCHGFLTRAWMDIVIMLLLVTAEGFHLLSYSIAYCFYLSACNNLGPSCPTVFLSVFFCYWNMESKLKILFWFSKISSKARKLSKSPLVLLMIWYMYR